MRKTIGKDPRGNYRVTLGNPAHVYYLGKVEDEAFVRRAKLSQLYKVEEPADNALLLSMRTTYARLGENPIKSWDDFRHEIGLAIAAGRPFTYQWLDHDMHFKLSALFPMATFKVAPYYIHGEAAFDMKEEETVEQAEPIPGAGWFHAALDAFQADLRLKVDPDTGTPTAKALTLCNDAERLRQHHADFRLVELDAAMWRSMLAYWAGRPAKKGKRKGEPHSVVVCQDTIKNLRRFLRFAEASSIWNRPRGWADPKVTVAVTKAEKDRRGNPDHRRHFKREEVRIILAACRTPWEKCVLLLGLNCGYAASELANLRIHEVRKTSIRGVRNKSGVPGRWPLWEETRQALDEYLAVRPKTRESSLLFVDAKGLPLTTREVSKTGKERGNTVVAQTWRKIMKRVKGQVRPLSHKYLRKTSARLVRKCGGGEVQKVFLCHGKPVESDKLSEAYSDPCFKPVADACERVGKWLLRTAKPATAS